METIKSFLLYIMGNNRSVYVRIGKKARFFVLHHRGVFSAL